MSAPRLVLASGSPRRADLLTQLGLDLIVHPADVDEVPLADEAPDEHAERLARAKAQAVSLVVPNALVLGGDTVVVDRGRILGKPAGTEDAVRMLLSLSGREHEVVSGVALASPRGIVSTAVRTAVRMRAFEEDEARSYVRTGEPFDKAGAYGIQGLGAALVERIDGDYYGVVGLPVHAFLGLLRRVGWRYDFGRLVPVSVP